MAEVQIEGRLVGLSFVVCGPSQAGKTTFLAAMRGPWRGIDDGAAALRCTPIDLDGDPPVGVAPTFVEIHPNDGDAAATEALVAAADGVLFVADSRRERLRDNLVAWAWLLERLREAKRDDVTIVIALHRRDAPNALPASDLDGALGAGRHPWFESQRDNPGGVLAPVIELVRRAAARAHPAVESLWPEWERGRFLGALDGKLGECNSRLMTAQLQAQVPVAPNAGPVTVTVTAVPVAVPAAVEPVASAPTKSESSRSVPAVPAMPETSARTSRRSKRSPMLRFATHFFGEAGRVARDRRRAVELLNCLVEDSKRPMAYLKILFGQLERETKRLSAPLQEALAGGGEVLKRIEQAFATAARGVAEQRPELVRESPFDLDEGLRACFSVLRRDTTVPRARLRLARLPTVRGDAEGLSALMWATLGAVLRATRRRERRVATVRVSARERPHGVRVRFARFDVARRGSGLDEMLLARRIAARLGIGFAIVAGRRGGRVIVLDLPPEMCIVEPSRRSRRPEPRTSLT
jgi:hypothetical protein